MNNNMKDEEAKEILAALRPGTRDAEDMLFQSALERARLDSKLASWLEEEQTFDQRMRNAMSQVKIPEDLHDSLMDLRPAMPFHSSGSRSRGGLPPWLAAAALLVLALGLGMWKMDWTLRQLGPPRPELLAREVMRLAEEERITLARTGEDTSQLRQWLKGQNAPHHFDLPAAFKNADPIGCQTYMVRGQRVSLLCFRIDDQRIVHFFVMDADTSRREIEGKPHFIDHNGVGALLWTWEGKTFVLLGRAVDENELKQLIRS